MNKYWQDRQLREEKKVYDKGSELIKEYTKYLDTCQREVQNSINKYTVEFMKEHKLNYNEANKYLSMQDKTLFKKDLKEFLKKYRSETDIVEKKKLYLEIDLIQTKRKIKRLEYLKAQIDMELIKYADEFEQAMQEQLMKVYEEVYNSLGKDIGLKAMLDKEKILELINKPFAGENYSQRIWSNTDKLARVVKQELVNSMIQGVNVGKMTDRITDRLDKAKYSNVERVVRTELNNAFNQATLKGYDDAEIKYYIYLATLDNRTSQICASLNGEKFKLDNAVTGINYPPMHPNCRSTTIPVIDYTDLKNKVESKL